MVEALGSSPRGAAPGERELTPRARRALERAERFSLQQRSPQVEVEHIVLGILDVEGRAGQVLRGLGVDVAAAGEVVAAMTAGRTAKVTVPAGEAAAGGAPRASVEAPVSGPAEAVVSAHDAADADRDPAPLTPEPRCGRCGETVAGGLAWRPVPAVGADGKGRDVAVVSCSTCGTVLAVLPLSSARPSPPPA